MSLQIPASVPLPPVAVLFPGLGAQHTGMGRNAFSASEDFCRTFEEASDLSGIALERLCREPSEKAVLARQLEGQLVLFTYGVAAYRWLCRSLPRRPTYFLGHSLGELTALCAAGAIDFADGVGLVCRRAERIAATAATLDGTMVWVLNLPRPAVEAVCRSWREQGAQVYVSAEDAPRQVAISGRAADVDAAIGTLERLGAMVFPLRLRGPYHCPQMAPAARALSEVLEGMTIRAPDGVVFSNAIGKPHGSAGDVRVALAQQLERPVLWVPAVEGLLADGVGLAIEIGPKAVLGFLMQKTTRALRTVALDAYPDPAALVAAHDGSTVDRPSVVARCRRLLATTRARTTSSETVPLGRRIAALSDGEAEQAVALVATWLGERGLDAGAVRLAVGGLVEGQVLGGTS